MEYIIALDQGTTSSRAVLFNSDGHLLDITQKEFTQIFPKPGWVEHNPEEIWATQLEVLRQLIKKNALHASQIKVLGITNQRETTIVWDKDTGSPIYNAIVWQDKRTASICEKIKRENDLENTIKKTTGLIVDSYFSATKVMWILENVEGARALAEKGQLVMGTVDTWLIWKLTNGEKLVTDFTNASRTLLFNIADLKWEKSLCAKLNIPLSMLPEVQPSASIFGSWNFEGIDIPIAGVAGDQQAALFGQACYKPGMAKNTYGTGCFMLMNTGDTPVFSKHGLLTTIAWGLNNKVEYALEGSIFIAGAAIQWLRDGLKMIASAQESETLAKLAAKNHGVYVVPAFAGLGAPYWDMYARGAIFGLTRGTSQADIAKATLDSLAYQTRDVLYAMEQDSKLTLQTLKVDGGAAANNLLMQFQSDILGVPVERPASLESTAAGAAYLAGITMGIWSQTEITNNREVEKVYEAQMSKKDRDKLYAGWQETVKRCMGWTKIMGEEQNT